VIVLALAHSLRVLDYPARFQFQSGAPCYGSSCCTDTTIQMVVEYYKERTYSLSYIRSKAQALTSYDERACTGINHIEVLNALRALGVSHYRVAFGIDTAFIKSKLAIGPVMVGVYYGSYPNLVGSGRANQAEHGGRNDWSFTGSHMVLAVHTQPHYSVTHKLLHTDVVVRDPDHGSANRPLKPKFDRFPLSKLGNAMIALPKYTAFNSTYCIYPTVKKTL
jgi:hypothetical protein